MTRESLIWMLPVVFIAHDLEEIIMTVPWLRRNAGEAARRYPRIAPVLMWTARLSVPAFALAVAVMFALVLAITVVTLATGWMAVWAAAVTVLLLHFLIHIGQWIVWRGYVPVILTSLPGAVWCLWALAQVTRDPTVGVAQVAGWTLVLLPVVAGWLVLAHGIAHRFDGWLRRRYGDGA